MSHNGAQPFQCKRRYKAHCAIRRRDEQAQSIREDDYLRTFNKEYESLAHIQRAMRR